MKPTNKSSQSYTARLSAYAASIEFDNLPVEVCERARQLILDGVGCGIFGSNQPWSQTLTTSITSLGSEGQASAWGTGRKVSADHAALLNGSYIQAFELDDYSRRGGIHGSAMVLPALMAAASFSSVSGRELLAAFVCGFEVGNRVGECLGAARLTKRGWHTGSVIGPVAAAAAAGRLLGLDSSEMEHAFGIAATQAGGLMASQYGSMVKRMHHGRASQSGLYAAVLAKQGYTGIEEVFEQPYGGYCSTFTGDVDQSSLELLTNGAGAEYRLLEAGIKPYACSAKIHVVLDAIKAIMDRTPFRHDEISAIKVHCTNATLVKTGWQYRATGSATEAQLNMAYNIAVMLLEKDAFVDQYRDELLTSSKVLDLIEKVTVVHEPSFDEMGPGSRHHVFVELLLANGTTETEELDHAWGSFANPLTTQEVEAKFDKLLAGRPSSEKGARLKSLISNLEELDDVSVFEDSLSDV